MTQIIEILKSLFDFFESIVDFIGSIISDLIEFIKMLGNVVTFLDNNYITFWLPTGALSIFAILITIMIILRVVDRD